MLKLCRLWCCDAQHLVKVIVNRKTLLLTSVDQHVWRKYATTPPDSTLCVYCDGSHRETDNHHAAGIGIHVPKMSNKFDICLPIRQDELKSAGNRFIELIAVTYSLIQALKVIESSGNVKYKRVVVYNDSTAAIKQMNSLMQELKANKWQVQGTSKYEDLTRIIELQDLIKLLKRFNGLQLEWKHVRAHNGNIQNEFTDYLAKSAMNMQPSDNIKGIEEITNDLSRLGFKHVKNTEVWKKIFNRVLYPPDKT